MIFNGLKDRIVSKLFIKQWMIMYNIGESISLDFKNYRKLIPPMDRIWADPFVVFYNNRYYVFVEEMFYTIRKGHIALIELDSLGNFLDLKKILEKPYHLSYPFIFKHEGDFFMIPESHQNNSIELYKSSNFPYEWKHEVNLMVDVNAVDSTLFHHNDLWWLFTNLVDNTSSLRSKKLHLFYSKNFNTDQWTPHPKNPIVTDISRSRSAGKIFIKNNDIVRPSQNCFKHYGHGINFNKITVLDEKNYKEKLERDFFGNWSPFIRGIHTYNHMEKMSVIDAQRLFSKFNK